MKRMLKNILKKKEPETPKKLCELDRIETATEQELRAACKLETNRWGIVSRIDNTVKYIQKMPYSPNESDEDRSRKIKVLHEKIEILRQCLVEKDREEAAKQKQAQDQQAEATAIRELPNVRWSIDPLIRTMRAQGTQAVPLNALKWQKTENPVIELHTPSGIKHLDLRKMPLSYWKLLEPRFTPVFIGIEGSGVIIDGKKQGIMLDSGFHPNKKYITQPSYIAIMLV